MSAQVELSTATAERILRELIQYDPGYALQVFVEEMGFVEAVRVLADNHSAYDVFRALVADVDPYDGPKFLRMELEAAIGNELGG